MPVPAPGGALPLDARLAPAVRDYVGAGLAADARVGAGEPGVQLNNITKIIVKVQVENEIFKKY